MLSHRFNEHIIGGPIELPALRLNLLPQKRLPHPCKSCRLNSIQLSVQVFRRIVQQIDIHPGQRETVRQIKRLGSIFHPAPFKGPLITRRPYPYQTSSDQNNTTPEEYPFFDHHLLDQRGREACPSLVMGWARPVSKSYSHRLFW